MLDRNHQANNTYKQCIQVQKNYFALPGDSSNDILQSTHRVLIRQMRKRSVLNDAFLGMAYVVGYASVRLKKSTLCRHSLGSGE